MRISKSRKFIQNKRMYMRPNIGKFKTFQSSNGQYGCPTSFAGAFKFAVSKTAGFGK